MGEDTPRAGSTRQYRPDDIQSSMDAIIDRRASIRAQHDLIALKLERLQDEHRKQLSNSAKLQQDWTVKDSQYKERIATLGQELLDQREQHRHHIDAASKFIGLLFERNRWLESNLQKNQPALQYALREEMELYRQEERFFNPPLLSASDRPKRHFSNQIRLITESGLFDHAHYARQFKPVLSPKTNLIAHYVNEGWRHGKNPNALFSVTFYLMRNQELAAEGIEPLSHYIEVGSGQLKDPHPLFSTEYFSKLVEPPGQGETWLGRFLQVGPSPPSPHPLFDAGEYSRVAQIPDSHTAVALLHYVTIGWRKRNFPFSQLFDVEYYESHFGEPIDSEPYLHYAIFGAAHGINPHPLFDTWNYLDQLPELDPLLTDPLVHYLLRGEREGVQPSLFFAPRFYREKYLNGHIDQSALLHYLTEGSEKLNDPHPYFSTKLHLEMARQLGSNVEARTGLTHFLRGGLWQIPSERIVTYFKESKFERGVGPVPSSSSAGTENRLIPRQYPGKDPYQEGWPNVLLVAHIAGEHLFGSERSFLDMADAIRHLPANLFVVLPRNVPDYTNAIRPLCHRVYIMDYQWWRKGQATSEQATDAFQHLINIDKIDAVHANTIMLREPLQAARNCGVPGIVHVRELIQHDRALQELIGEASEEITRQTRNRADWVIGNSAVTAAAFAKEGRTFTIPNTIDLDAMDIPNVVQDDVIRFGLISSNLPKKGVSDVIDLARLASRSLKKAKFVVIGPDTDIIKGLKEEQKSGRVPDNVLFAGYAKSPKQAIERVNVVLNFSHFAESFGRTVLEAMAARRPVIGYRWGALPELIDHNESGYLVPFKKVADAVPFVEGLCEDPDTIKRLGERGRQIAISKFGLRSYRAKFVDAYSKILPPRAVEAKPFRPLVRQARNPSLKNREDRPRVAYFCWHFPVPSETFVLNELESLVADGVDVRVFCRQIPWKDFKPSFPISFERVDSPKQLAKRLKETERTIVHAHFVYPVVTDMVWPACEEAEIPFTFIAHAQDIFRHDNDQKNRLSEIGASKWCRALFTLSKFHLDFVVGRGFPREKIIINPNAVDTERFSAAHDEGRQNRATRKIIAIHRFVRKKGLELLIQAGPLVADLGVEIEIYGYGELEEEYQRLIAQSGATNVEIKGPLSQDQIVAVMKTADLFAAPSVRTSNGDMDGIPTSVVESMAAGLPVLTTDVAGIPDLVVNEMTGIVVGPTPEGVAEGIRRFYSLPSLKVRAIIRAAAERAQERHDVARLKQILMRVWRNETIDLLVVAWNNLAELKMVVARIMENTSLPYHLIICDNQSRREPVPDYLDRLWREQDRVTVIHNNVNAMVGPGTNAALAQGCSDYAIYVCGKEGVSFARGWEIPIIRALEQQPDVGLVGTICYSPTYLHGAQYPTGIELFPKFRNRSFATDNPTRLFGHVQGGLFGMRRKMVTEIGGFSDDVPHSYTDVEYSYYAESKGWKLANVPNMLALYNKSRPTLSQRFDESLFIAHPVLANELDRYDAVARGDLKHCNVCDWYGAAFDDEGKCPSCVCSPDDRSVYRWLSDGIFMYRRLPALATGLKGRLEKEWAKQFQGPRLTAEALIAELEAKGRLSNKPGSFHLSLIRCGSLSAAHLKLIATELKRVTIRGGTALLQKQLTDAKAWRAWSRQLTQAMENSGFKTLQCVQFSSGAVNYSFIPISAFEKVA
jgi:glycosyltransferase involved in cell wall biosynthesis/GT2 family glycosyltransferase